MAVRRDSNERIALSKVLQRTVNVGNAEHIARGQYRGGAGGKRDSRARTRARHNDGLPGLGQRDAYALRLTSCEETDFFFDRFKARCSHRHHKRAAQTQTRSVEVTARIGGQLRTRARRLVSDGDVGARHRIAIGVHHAAANRRGGFLSENRRSNHGGSSQADNARGKKISEFH